MTTEQQRETTHQRAPWPSALGGILVLGVLGFALSSFVGTHPVPIQPIRVLAAGEGLKWFKGNMHTHSHWSDGDDYLENIALWYREKKYDFLVFTDHNVLARSERWVDVEKTKGGQKAYDKLKQQFPDWIDERTVDGKQQVRLRMFPEVVEKVGVPDKFLLIQGEEISDRFGKSPIHLNASNIQTAIPPLGGNTVTEAIQNNVNAVIAQRERENTPILVHLNHPNFQWGVTAEDIFPVRGENFFEVYNGHPGVHNHGDHVHAGTEAIWDIINSRRLTETDLPLMYGLGTDDGHNYHNIPSRASEPGRAWVMVLASDLSVESLITAMEAGQFYASSGVTLDRVSFDGRDLTVAVRPDEGVTYRIDFIGTREDFDRSSEPVRDEQGAELPVTRRYSKDVGAVFQSSTGESATYRMKGNELYVRCKVVSSRPHPNPSEMGDFENAWTQPVRPAK